MSSAPVGNGLFEPILQCVSRYTATRLVTYGGTQRPPVVCRRNRILITKCTSEYETYF